MSCHTERIFQIREISSVVQRACFTPLYVRHPRHLFLGRAGIDGGGIDGFVPELALDEHQFFKLLLRRQNGHVGHDALGLGVPQGVGMGGRRRPSVEDPTDVAGGEALPALVGARLLR